MGKGEQMTLTTIDIQVPTDRLPAVNGAEATVSAQAKLLPSAPRVHFQPGGEMDVSISTEIAAELAVGDVIAVPPGVGEPRPFEIIGDPVGGWVRVRPARDKHTLVAALSEANARDADLKRRQQRASNERLDRAREETERGLAMLREAGFKRVADAVERSGVGYSDGLDSRLREDVAAMGDREAVTAGTPL